MYFRVQFKSTCGCYSYELDPGYVMGLVQLRIVTFYRANLTMTIQTGVIGSSVPQARLSPINAMALVIKVTQ